MPLTNLDQVKAVARMLLMTDIHETEFSPVIVQHPFTSTGICVLTNDGENKMIDITKSEDDLRSWREYFLNQINKSKSAYQIFVMINKPYGLTFLKCAQPYISNEEFSKILAEWTIVKQIDTKKRKEADKYLCKLLLGIRQVVCELK